jgi:hypothetical protein
VLRPPSSRKQPHITKADFSFSFLMFVMPFDLSWSFLLVFVMPFHLGTSPVHARARSCCRASRHDTARSSSSRAVPVLQLRHGSTTRHGTASCRAASCSCLAVPCQIVLVPVPCRAARLATLYTLLLEKIKMPTSLCSLYIQAVITVIQRRHSQLLIHLLNIYVPIFW